MRSVMPWIRASVTTTAVGLFALTALNTLPAHAVSCEDVRKLSKAEQDYWSKQLNLTGEQRHRIWVACYRDYHPDHPIMDIAQLR
jgi:Spy/CpxP family protein refolding chaperone